LVQPQPALGTLDKESPALPYYAAIKRAGSTTAGSWNSPAPWQRLIAAVGVRHLDALFGIA